MNGLDILDRFERTPDAWICVEPLTFHFPDGKVEFDRGAVVPRDAWLGRQLDRLATLRR